MSYQQEVADRIAQLRREKAALERRDLTQGMIAEACGLNPVTYSRYESGARKVPEEVIGVLADYFGTTRQFIRYGVGGAPVVTFRIPDDMAEIFLKAQEAAAEPSPPAVAPEPELPKKAAAGGRPASKRPKGRQ